MKYRSVHLTDEAENSRKETWDDKVVAWFSPKWEQFKLTFALLILAIAFIAAYLFNHVFINIFPGEAGVLWKRFDGGTQKQVFGGGLHVINPFNKMYKYEIRVQQEETTFTVLSNNGLTIKIHASVRFMPKRDRLYLLHEEVGPDYVERVVIPETQAVIRRVIGEYEPNEIYATQRNILQNVVLTALSELQHRHIILDDLLIKEIQLPPAIASAIESKLKEEQLLLAYDYITQREVKEAKRKEIEAGGIRKFQETIKDGLTPGYLRFKGIAATLELAKSPNAKLVVIGNNEDGLPLILNTPDDFDTSARLPSTNLPPADKSPPVDANAQASTNAAIDGKK